MSQPLHPLALDLNKALEASSNAALSLLSGRGRAIYFPSKGILGQSAQAKGSALNATIGTAFEEDGTPMRLPSVMEDMPLGPKALLYAPSWGRPELRKRWQEMEVEKNPSLRGKSFSLPVATCALTHGVSVAGHLFLDEGDQVILPDLYWDNYELVLGHAYGAELVTFNTFKDGGYDVDALLEKVNAPGEKKVILLNFPNNPTGYTPTVAEAEAIQKGLLKAAQAGKKIAVLIDDAYFGLVYREGVEKESLFARLVDLHENVLAVKLDGATKEDYVWGLRVGFVAFGGKGLGPEALKALEAKAAGVVRCTISNASNPAQLNLLKAFTSPTYAAEKAEKYATLRARHDKIVSIFAAHPEYRESFEPMPFNSGYFMCVKPVGVEAEAVRQELNANFSTGTIVLSGLIRLAFSAVKLEDLDKLFANIDAAVRKLRGA